MLWVDLGYLIKFNDNGRMLLVYKYISYFSIAKVVCGENFYLRSRLHYSCFLFNKAVDALMLYKAKYFSILNLNTLSYFETKDVFR